MAWSQATTYAGLNVLANLTDGGTLKVVRAAGGTGYVDVTALKEQTALKSEKIDLQLNDYKNKKDGKITIPLLLVNDKVNTTFFLNQIGIFVEDSKGNEVLFVILQEESGIEIYSAAEMPDFSAEWNVRLGYGNATSIVVDSDPAGLITKALANEYFMPRSGVTWGMLRGDST